MKFYIIGKGYYEIHLVELETCQTINGIKTGRIHLENDNEKIAVRMEVKKIQELINSRTSIIKNGHLETETNEGKTLKPVQVKKSN